MNRTRNGMCGIAACFGEGADRAQLVAMAARLRHRGPDASGVVFPAPHAGLAQERLEVVDAKGGEQSHYSRHTAAKSR